MSENNNSNALQSSMHIQSLDVSNIKESDSHLQNKRLKNAIINKLLRIRGEGTHIFLHNRQSILYN
jgi:hypothetical protein